MMKHIQQLAAFKTGLDVRIGYPNEHLTEGTAKEMASPMFATGIGLVIEGIARAEYEEKMDRAKHRKAPITSFKPVEEKETEDPVQEMEDRSQEADDKRRKRREPRERKRGFNITEIITKIFSEENEVDE